MSLIDRMQKDSQRIMNSSRYGFSIPIVLTSPSGDEYSLMGIVSIIHNLVDPDTGQPVSGFLATVSINYRDLNDSGIDLPEGEMSSSARPWLVTATNVIGVEQTMKLVRSSPDETNGNILCDLGSYER